MRRIILGLASLFAVTLGAQQQAGYTESPYHVLTRARVGGEGGWDYITADPIGRRLYIPRGMVRAAPATDSTPAREAVAPRIAVYDLDDLKPLGEILTAPNSQGNGVAVDPKSGHGFSSSRPQITMFDTKTLQVLKSIPIDSGVGPDGILFDGYNDRVYVFSHPTRDATVIDSRSGNVLGRIALGGTPEQGVSDGAGKLYVVMQDVPGGVAVVDTRSMKTIAHYPFTDAGRCNGLALDSKNHVLFAACANSGNPPAQPPSPVMVILSADDGHVVTTLPLAGGSDGAAFNPATMEAFSTHGNGTLTVIKENSPTSFVVEQNLQTMNGARTITFDSRTGRLLTMRRIVNEPGIAGACPPRPPPGGGGGAGPRSWLIVSSRPVLESNVMVRAPFTILLIGK